MLHCHDNKHVWDTDYEKESKSEKLCVCCGHIFISEEREEDAIDGAISWPSTSIHFSTKKPISPTGLNKGKITRRN